MCSFTKCCCCLDLRIGAIIIAVLELVMGIPCLVLAILYSTSVIPGADGTIYRDDRQLQTIAAIIITLTAFNYLKSVSALVTGLCLLFGSIFNKKILTLIYLVLKLLSIVVAGIEMIVGIVGGSLVGTYLGDPHDSVINHSALVLMISMIVLLLISIILQTYFWICVFSFYNRELKGKKTISHT